MAPLGALFMGGAAGSAGAAAVGLGAASMIGGVLSKPKGITAPPPRSYQGEMEGALRAQQGVQDLAIGLEGLYTPRWQEQQMKALQGQLGNLNTLYGGLNNTSAGLMSDYARAMESTYGLIGKTASSAYNQTLDPSMRSLLGTMGARAQAGLDAGYGLTPEMQTQAQQASRAAMTARGLTNSNQGIAAEILGGYNMGNARYQQSLANAGTAAQLGMSQANAAMQTYGTPLFAGTAGYNPTAMLGTATGFNQNLGPNIFQPESQYNAAIMGANQSNELQASLANQQAQAGFSSGLMSMGGNILGGYLKGK